MHQIEHASSPAPGPAHLALLDDVAGLAVALADELGGLARVARLQLTRRHHDRPDAQLLERQVALERLALALAAPDACRAGQPGDKSAEQRLLVAKTSLVVPTWGFI